MSFFRQESDLLCRGGIWADVKLSSNAVAKEYGRKASGLLILPVSWSPPFAALPLWIYETWLTTQRIAEALTRLPSDLTKVMQVLTTNGHQRLIIRSSAGAETLEHRGLYLSRVVHAKASITDVAREIEAIYDHFRRQERTDSLGIILQSYIEPDLAGHLSNEVHLSPTRNQWKYEVEKPDYAPHVGLNSKDAVPIDSERPISVLERKQLKNVFRMVGRWINEHVAARTHIEWCLSENNLWLVQLDTERPSSTGIDPRLMPAVRGIDPKRTAPSPRVFTLYEVGADTPWQKLQNIADFNVGTQVPHHRLYFADGSNLTTALDTPEGIQRLATEIDDLTNHRAVVRTDLLTVNLTALNLPRTQTVSGTHAVAWILEQLPRLVSKVDHPENVCFIVHGFIPARSSAWSYFVPGDDIVEIDTLWGLPDGLQFLPHDSFKQMPGIGGFSPKRLDTNLKFFKNRMMGLGDICPWLDSIVDTDLCRSGQLAISLNRL
jgi:hypothetical protein